MTHTVSLYHPGPNQWVDESPINQWLVANVGISDSLAWADPLSPSQPWQVEHYPSRLVYYFYRDKDAIMFALRWA